MIAVKILVSIVPVLLFLAFLIILDSFKLIRKNVILVCLVWGLISAILAYYLNTSLINGINFGDDNLGLKIFPPLVEESLKIIMVLILVRLNKIGFLIDGAIYGFAVGAGFSLIENLYYLYEIKSDNIALWIVRGFGTAIMHGGTIAVASMTIMQAIGRQKNSLFSVFFGWLMAMTIHFIFNRFYFSPVISTIIIIIALPTLIVYIFNSNENSLRNWLDIEFDAEVKMLQMIKKGKFASTRSGEYLLTIKNRFSPLVVFDMLTYVSLFLELSIKAKRNLLLKESGFEVIKIPALDNYFKEMKSLRKSIGKTGLMAIHPILRMSKKDLWKLTLLE